MDRYEEALAKARAGKSLDEIFPEMNESDDERIRKCLIDMVKRETGFTGFPSQGQVLTFLEKQKEQPTDEEMLRTLRVEYEKGVADTIAKYEREQTEELSTRLNGLMQEYVKSGKDEEEQEHRFNCYKLFWDALEDSEFFEQFKQKEQKPVAGENPQTSAEILRHYLVWAGNSEEDCPYTWKTLADAIRDGIKALEEQKSAEWSEFDKGALEDAICAADMLGNDESFNKGNPHLAKAFRVAKDRLKSLSLNLKKQNEDVAKLCSNEWSEEDEKMLDKVCCLISPGTILNASNADYCLELKQWIVSLQERILKLSCIQPKQEWSEEDEKRVVELKTLIIQCKGFNKANLQKALKLIDALRPDSYKNCNSRWKPSEEQEVDLEKIIEQTYHDGSVADTSDMDHVDYDNIARHFYDLGLNARRRK